MMIHSENKRIFSAVPLDKNIFKNNLILILKLLPIKYLYIIYIIHIYKNIYLYNYFKYSLRNRGREEGRKEASKQANKQASREGRKEEKEEKERNGKKEVEEEEDR